VLAASRATAEQLQAMRVSVAEAAEPASRGVFRQADHRFHTTVAEASGSPRLLAAVVQARGELFVPVDAIQYQDRFTETCEEHAAILVAIQRHDAAAAAAAMEAHLESSLRDLLDMVAEPPTSGRRQWYQPRLELPALGVGPGETVLRRAPGRLGHRGIGRCFARPRRPGGCRSHAWRAGARGSGWSRTPVPR
jgi:hypothetical protein